MTIAVYEQPFLSKEIARVTLGLKKPPIVDVTSPIRANALTLKRLILVLKNVKTPVSYAYPPFTLPLTQQNGLLSIRLLLLTA